MKHLFVICIFLSGVLDAHTLSLSNPKKDWTAFFNSILSTYPIDTFVESGTYLGQTAQHAARIFPQVETVEIYEEFYHKAQELLSQYNNVTIHHDSTINIFPQIISKLTKHKKNTLFWLDGHFMTSMSQDETAENFLPSDFTPVEKELEIIKESNLKQSIILIDDIRLFGTLLNNKRIERAGNIHYPLLATTRAYLQEMGYASVILGDILFAYDQTIPITFSPVIHACTMSRTFDGNNYDINELLEAETIIAQTTGQECEALEELYHDFSKPWRGWYNKSPHYNLWYGLMLQHKGSHQEACEQFEEVLNLGYDHWRIYWYLAQSLAALQKLELAQHALHHVTSLNPDFKPTIQYITNL